jgi:ribosome-associated heat shock protein Hsp15
VRVKGPAHPAVRGDIVTIALGRRIRVLRIKGFSDRRGGADEARALYEDVEI